MSIAKDLWLTINLSQEDPIPQPSKTLGIVIKKYFLITNLCQFLELFSKEHETLLQVYDFHPERLHSSSHRSNLDPCELQVRRRSWIFWNLDIYMTTTFVWENSVNLPGKGLHADPVDGAGKKAVGNRCIPCLHQIYQKTNKEKVTFLVFIRFIKN